MHEAATGHPEPNQTLHDQRMRRASDDCALFRLCRRMRCRRAEACRGLPRECVARYMPLVPQEAREFLVGLAVARRSGVPFETAIAGLKEELAAFARWREAIGRR